MTRLVGHLLRRIGRGQISGKNATTKSSARIGIVVDNIVKVSASVVVVIHGMVRRNQKVAAVVVIRNSSVH